MTRNGQRGWTSVEVLVSIGLLVMLVGSVGSLWSSMQKLNRGHLARQRCLAAAQAQIEHVARTGRPLGEGDVERLWPGIQLTVERTPGAGQWEGLHRLKVVARCEAGGQEVNLHLARYVKPPASLFEGP